MSSKQYRLAIGGAECRRSGTWRVWSNLKGDIYVANRCLGGVYKASFHRDRRCQFGFTSEYAEIASQRFGQRERHLERWSLPESALVRGLQILIPENELRTSAALDNKGITWLKAPPLGCVGTMSLFITDRCLQLDIPTGVPGAMIVGKLDTSIRTAWITYAFTNPDDELTKLIEFEKSRLNMMLSKIAVPPGTRASLWDSRTDHNRHVLELSCDSAG